MQLTRAQLRAQCSGVLPGFRPCCLTSWVLSCGWLIRYCGKHVLDHQWSAMDCKMRIVSAVQIDATLDENKPLATRFGIGGFPTIKVRHMTQ